MTLYHESLVASKTALWASVIQNKGSFRHCSRKLSLTKTGFFIIFFLIIQLMARNQFERRTPPTQWSLPYFRRGDIPWALSESWDSPFSFPRKPFLSPDCLHEIARTSLPPSFYGLKQLVSKAIFVAFITYKWKTFLPSFVFCLANVEHGTHSLSPHSKDKAPLLGISLDESHFTTNNLHDGMHFGALLL